MRLNDNMKAVLVELSPALELTLHQKLGKD